MGFKLNKIDIEILKILQENCRVSIEEISKKLGIPKSTVRYRVKRMEREKIIDGYYAKINPIKLGKDYLTIIFIRAKYGPAYHETIGKKLMEIPGVWGIYFIFGESDFVLLMRSRDRYDYLKKLEKIMNMKEVERTNTQIIAKVIKEDPRIDL
ncbi:Lrp/AsnC family transcriptional regulator [Candidatus Bathyarchaeota archaeon]|nr:Lrp/AsnC family transcriptional regulator [Candidatus Bathyarchaeota archaeon]